MHICPEHISAGFVNPTEETLRIAHATICKLLPPADSEDFAVVEVLTRHSQLSLGRRACHGLQYGDKGNYGCRRVIGTTCTGDPRIRRSFYLQACPLLSVSVVFVRAGLQANVCEGERKWERERSECVRADGKR